MFKKIILALLYTNHKAILLYRIGSWFHHKNMKKTAYAIKSLGITLNGCDISPAAKIGKNITFCHTVGIVIGEGAVTGDNLTIYQNVTIGTKDRKTPDYPTVGNDVTLFAGCVLADPIKIGNNSVVGANSLALQDVPSNSLAVGMPAQVKKQKTP